MKKFKALYKVGSITVTRLVWAHTYAGAKEEAVMQILEYKYQSWEQRRAIDTLQLTEVPDLQDHVDWEASHDMDLTPKEKLMIMSVLVSALAGFGGFIYWLWL